MNVRYRVELSQAERCELTAMLSKGKRAARKLKRAQILPQPLGYSHALWEVVVDTLKRSANPLDRTANRDALKAINLNTLVGPIKFSGAPHPNICKTPIFGGQWVKGEKWPFDLKIVDNSVSKLVQPEGKLKLLTWS